MLHIIKQFTHMFVTPLMFSEIPGGSSVVDASKGLLEAAKEISSDKINNPESQELIAKTRIALEDLYNDVRTQQLRMIKSTLGGTKNLEKSDIESILGDLKVTPLGSNTIIEQAQFDLRLSVDGKMSEELKNEIIKVIDIEIAEREEVKTKKVGSKQTDTNQEEPEQVALIEAATLERNEVEGFVDIEYNLDYEDISRAISRVERNERRQNRSSTHIRNRGERVATRVGTIIIAEQQSEVIVNRVSKGEYNVEIKQDGKTVMRSENQQNISEKNIKVAIEKLVNENAGVEKFIEQKSGNSISTVQGSILGMKGKVEKKGEYLGNINRTSFETILRTTPAYEIFTAITEGTDVGDDPIKFKDYIVTENFTGAIKYLKGKGYEKNNVTLDYKEMHSLYNYALDVMMNQYNARKGDSLSKFKQLIDFDGDGLLETENNYYMGELQGAFLNVSDKVGGFENLYENLGLNQKDLESQMGTDFFNANEAFQLRVQELLLMGVKPGELFVKGGTTRMLIETYETMRQEEEFKKEFEKENAETILKVKGALKSKFINKFPGKSEYYETVDFDKKMDKISLSSLFLLFGASEGLALSFNIEEFTDGLIDNLSLGMVSGAPGIILSKNFFEDTLHKYGANLSASLVNFVYPIIGISKDIIEGEFDKVEAVNTDADTYRLTGFASFGTKAQALGLQVSKLSEGTSGGIEKIGYDLDSELSEMVTSLLNGTEYDFTIANEDKFTETQLKSADILLRRYYSSLEHILISVKDVPDAGKVSALNNAKDTIVQGITDKLYRFTDADGLDFSTAGFGIAFIAGALPLPFIMGSFESVDTEFNVVDHSYERESRITKKTEYQDVQIETFEGNRVMKLENKYSISVPEGYSLQANLERGSLYIGGDIDDVRIHTHVENNQARQTLVINGGELNEQGRYEYTYPAEFSEIQDNVTLNPDLVHASRLDEAHRATSGIRKDIDTIFSDEVLRSNSTPGAIALQNAILDFAQKDSQGTIQEVFAQLQSFVDNNLQEYADENGLNTEFESLQSSLQKQNTENEDELEAIIISVNNNFMEKGALKNIDGVVTMEPGMTVRRYDVIKDGKPIDRAKYFDETFEAAGYSTAMIKEIQKARTIWQTANGNAEKFNFVPVSNGNLASTGVAMNKVDENGTVQSEMRAGIMNYEGVYNIASIDGGVDYVPMENDPSYINNLPNSFLENIRTKLNKAGANLESLEEVKDYINNNDDKDIKVNYEIAFARMGECLNDAIILKDFTIKTTNSISSSLTSTMNTQTQDVTSLGIALTGEIEKKGGDERGGNENEQENNIETDTGNQGSNNNGSGVGTNDSGFGGGVSTDTGNQPSNDNGSGVVTNDSGFNLSDTKNTSYKSDQANGVAATVLSAINTTNKRKNK